MFNLKRIAAIFSSCAVLLTAFGAFPGPAAAAEEAAAEDAAPVEEEEPPHALSAALMVTAPEASRKLRREIFLIMKNLLQWFS